jgi:spermidine synthase
MYLSLLVFVCGGAVMALEIVGSRFFAPYIGTSIVVWTSLIGMVMAGLSCGYMLGGIYGDKWKSLSKLRQIVGASGVWILLIIVIRDPLLGVLSSTVDSVMITAIVGTAVLLLVPSVLLGMVTPYAIRLSVQKVDTVGHIAGKLSALSTLGSIAGTFLAGFALVPSAGTTAILFGIATVLVLTAALGTKPQHVNAALLFLLSAGIFLQINTAERALAYAKNGVLSSVDTPYSSMQVQKLTDTRSDREFYLLRIDGGTHGAMYTNSSDMVFEYTKYYRAADVWRPNAERALLIGGGSYTVARDYLARHTDSAIDVVEIDPAVTETAREYFGLTDDERMRIFHEDARIFLNREGPKAGENMTEKYEVVFGDAFRSESTVPFHLTTKEAVQKIYTLLDENGVYLLNVIGSLEGPRSMFPKAQLATLSTVFPSTLVLDVHEDLEPTAMRNIMLIASKAPLDTYNLSLLDAELASLLQHTMHSPNWGEEATVLTDNYAPVEAMLHL